MSQALASLSRNLLAFFTCTLLVACNGSYTAFESDRDFNVEIRTADIEKDNAELKTLAAIQSAFFGHYHSAVNEFLDASDLNINASRTATLGKKEYEYLCPNGGSALYTYTRDSGEEHKVGDIVSVIYDEYECLEDDATYSGAMEGRYTQIKGLNNRFVELDTTQCLARVQDNLNINDTYINSAEYDNQNGFYIINGNEIFLRNNEIEFTNNAAVYLKGDELRFERVGNDLMVDLLRVSFVDDTDDDIDNEEKVISVELSLVIKESQKVIIVLEPLNQSSEMVTSIDGDQIYTIEELKDEKQECQSFQRTLNVSLTDFSTSKVGFLQTILNGSVSLEEAQETPNRMNQSFVDSDFTTTVVQGNSRQTYTMKDYRVEKAINFANNTYAYEFEGLVSNTDVLDGVIGLTTVGKLYGSLGSDFPSSGIFELQGKGLERINLIPDNARLVLQVDFNGDSTGNGFADIDTFINTNWVDLFERNFIE